MLASMIQKFNTEAQKHLERQSLNPFSGSFSRSPSPRLSNDEYGKPIAGSKTEERGKKAKCHVLKEVLELCNCIYDVGMSNAQAQARKHGEDTQIDEDDIIVTFKEVFQIYTNINDKVVGLLIAAKKRGFLYFEKEILFQRQDDDVLIALIKPISEIRATINKEIYPQTAAAAAKLEEGVANESNNESHQDFTTRNDSIIGNENLPEVAVSDASSDSGNENRYENQEIVSEQNTQINNHDNYQRPSSLAENDQSNESSIFSTPDRSDSLIIANNMNCEMEENKLQDNSENGSITEKGLENEELTNNSIQKIEETEFQTNQEMEDQNIMDDKKQMESSNHELPVEVVQSTENEEPENNNNNSEGPTPTEVKWTPNDSDEHLNECNTVVDEDTTQTQLVPESERTALDEECTQPILQPNEFTSQEENLLRDQESHEEKHVQNNSPTEKLLNLTLEDEMHQDIQTDNSETFENASTRDSDSIQNHRRSVSQTDLPEEPMTEFCEVKVSHVDEDMIPTSEGNLLPGTHSPTSKLEDHGCADSELATTIDKSNTPNIEECFQIIDIPMERSITPDNCDKEVEAILEHKTSLLGEQEQLKCDNPL